MRNLEKFTVKVEPNDRNEENEQKGNCITSQLREDRKKDQQNDRDDRQREMWDPVMEHSIEGVPKGNGNPRLKGVHERLSCVIGHDE